MCHFWTFSKAINSNCVTPTELKFGQDVLPSGVIKSYQNAPQKSEGVEMATHGMRPFWKTVHILPFLDNLWNYYLRQHDTYRAEIWSGCVSVMGDQKFSNWSPNVWRCVHGNKRNAAILDASPRNRKCSITSLYIAQSAWNFTRVIRVPPWWLPQTNKLRKWYRRQAAILDFSPRNRKCCVTSLYMLQSAWNFTCVIRVQPWRVPYADLNSRSERGTAGTLGCEDPTNAACSFN